LAVAVTSDGEATFGERLSLHRRRTGMTRPVLGGLVGRSAEWVKAVETGRLGPPRLPMLLRLAEVLGISDLADLTGDQSMTPARHSYGQHPAVPAIRDAVQRYILGPPAVEPHPVATLRTRVAAAWRTWHSSATRRSDVGAMLPALITDCQVAAAHEGPERRAAHAVLADAFHLAQHVLVNAAEPQLQWRVVERAMTAARIADEPLALAGAAWSVGNLLRIDGAMDAALTLVRDAAAVLEPRMAEEPPDWLGLWGALQLHAAVTAARAGRDGDAWNFWDRAERATRRLPAGYAHPWTAFGEANVRLHAVSLTMDLWRSREALRRAESIEPESIPSRERRGRLFVELARGHHAARDRRAATRLLLRACDEGTDGVRYSPAARHIVDDLAARPPAGARDEVQNLLTRLGLDRT
jgi:transcriptional regulator with XRE-family HTH domain